MRDPRLPYHHVTLQDLLDRGQVGIVPCYGEDELQLGYLEILNTVNMSMLQTLPSHLLVYRQINKHEIYGSNWGMQT